ncbi:hypothetical protein OG730_41890 (plasmid) [Streptomyces sp. NBC_01298]|uniref:hypothetical protein n=1 Tax=Streptomyces sp. NBC_01298 TaxID=2903817 RepID=UPI002E140DFF|nr:hypothetical protein OG730_41890 [Streptomyces sp. NBC_01298]
MPHPTDQQVADLREALGHYTSATAKALMDEGLPTSSISVFDGEDSKLDAKHAETESYIQFPVIHALRHGPRRTIAQLRWDGFAGWEYSVEGGGPMIEVFMGAGLTPDPARVASFATACMIDHTSVGSREKPRYRSLGEGLDGLTAILDGYARDNGFRRLSADETYADARVLALRRGLAADLTTAQAPVSVPLYPGEIRALTRLIEWMPDNGYESLGELLRYLSHDLSGRATAAAPATAPDAAFTTALAEADEQRQAGL